MKNLILILPFVCTLITHNALAQLPSVSCDDFSITDIVQDPSNSSQYLISIQFNAVNTAFINMPFVSSLLDENNDTIASGNMNFFGQNGGTEQDYMVTSNGNGNMNASQFTAVFIYNSDTCYLTFPGNNTASQDVINSEQELSLSPNPVQSHLHVTVPSANLIGATFNVFDFSGKSVLTGRINSMNTTIDLEDLESGMYLFQYLKQTQRIMKK